MAATRAKTERIDIRLTVPRSPASGEVHPSARLVIRKDNGTRQCRVRYSSVCRCAGNSQRPFPVVERNVPGSRRSWSVGWRQRAATPSKESAQPRAVARTRLTKGIRRRDAKVVGRQERSGSVAGRLGQCRATRLWSSVRSCKEKAHNSNSWGCRRCGGNLQNVVCRMVTKRGNSAQSKRTVVCSCTEEIRNSNSTWCWNCAGMPRNCEG